ncbi:hypothetical protein F5Y19DRAFT_485533 [Xylariaceae sp. FL1651]|nr:hypothetical protein F5Y19DRAFT_485533 [Xylariaceae sp. FL1651]
MSLGTGSAGSNIEQKNVRQCDTEQDANEQQTHSDEQALSPPVHDDRERHEPDQEPDSLEKYNPLIDKDLHKLVTEWRRKKLEEDYEPYSEDLRRFGTQWSVRMPQKGGYMPTQHEINGKVQELETLHDEISRVIDRFYELSWTRRFPDYWDHVWLTSHLAGATIEEVWEIGPWDLAKRRTCESSSRPAGKSFLNVTTFFVISIRKENKYAA